MCSSYRLYQFEFSKEDEITSLLDEVVEKSDADQNVETNSDNVATSVDTFSRENVATSSDQSHDNNDETKSASTGMFSDLIKRQPSLGIKMNHPSNLIIGSPSDGMVTRRRYVNLINYVCYTSMIEPKNVKEEFLD